MHADEEDCSSEYRDGDSHKRPRTDLTIGVASDCVENITDETDGNNLVRDMCAH